MNAPVSDLAMLTRTQIAQGDWQVAAENILRAISSAQYSGDFKSANAIATHAQKMARTVAQLPRSHEVTAWAEHCMALAWHYPAAPIALGHYRRAIALYFRCRQPAFAARAAVGAAGVALRTGAFSLAQGFFRTVHAYLPKSSPMWPLVWMNASFGAVLMGNFKYAISCARRARNQASKPAGRIQPLFNIVLAELMMGRSKRARQTAQLALDEAMTAEGAQLDGRALMHVALAEAACGHLFEAIRLYDRALAVFERIGLHIERATIAMDRGRIYWELGLPELAGPLLTGAHRQFQEAGYGMEAAHTLLLAVRGAVISGPASFEKDALRAAFATETGKLPFDLHALLSAYRRHPLLEPPGAGARKMLGRLATRLGRAGSQRASAEVLWVEAQVAAVRQDRDSQIKIEAAARALRRSHQHSLEMFAWQQRALIAEDAGALRASRRALFLARAQHATLAPEAMKAQWFAGHGLIHQRAIFLLLRHKKNVEALAATLNAKAAVWLDASNSIGAKAMSAYRSQIAYWEDRRSGARDPVTRLICERRLSKLDRQVNALARGNGRISARELQENVVRRLPSSSAAIEYVVCEDTIFACVLERHSRPQWREVCKASEIQQLLQTWHLHCTTEASRRRDGSSARTAAAEPALALARQLSRLLFDVLIRDTDVMRHRHLLIAPDGLLHAVPWLALQFGTRDLVDGRVSFMPSVACLLQVARASTGRQAVVLGAAGTPALGHVQQEVRDVGRWLNARIVLPEARAEDFAQASQASVLHLAMHMRHASAPLLSSLSFADRAMSVSELIQHSLKHTGLVTLSGCDALRLPAHGGLAFALGGACLLAGAHTVLATLWQVHDEATRIWMNAFYQALRVHQDPAGAMCRAAATVRAISGFSHPYYWSGFQLLARVLPRASSHSMD